MKTKRAVTLTELMVAIAIFIFIAIGLLLVLNYSRNSIEIVKISSNLQEELENALYIMIRELRQTQPAKIIAGPTSANDIWYNEVSFAKPFDIDGDSDILNSSSAIEWSEQATPAWTVRYFLSGNQLQRSGSGGVSSVLANHVSAVGFKRSASTPMVIQISLTGRANTFLNRPIDIFLTNEVTMRN
jgi:type II secretory pathway component PulJ